MNNSLIIERPDLQSMTQRYGWKSVTLVFWIFYIYLWTPLITLAVWWIGVKLFHINMIKLKGYESLVDNLGLYSFIILSISIILIGWAEINRFRFRNKVRRLDKKVLEDDDVAEKFNLEVHQLMLLRKKKSIIVHFSKAGDIREIR